jgi:hypothetical protein
MECKNKLLEPDYVAEQRDENQLLAWHTPDAEFPPHQREAIGIMAVVQ